MTAINFGLLKISSIHFQLAYFKSILLNVPHKNRFHGGFPSFYSAYIT